MSDGTIHIVGAGMAGSEAAWQAAEAGAQVVLHEMRPERGTEAHKTGDCAELVCSNSFRSDDAQNNAVGLLHEEMRRAGSLIMRMADRHSLPAGGALAVDRETFARAVTEALAAHPRVALARGEVGWPPEAWGPTIIATGPLTAPALAAEIRRRTGADALAFFDAIAPIVYFDSVDLSRAWFQSRYDKGETEAERTAYLNCPMSREEYDRFIDALLAAPATEFKDWEKDTPYFEGCLPVEVMAARGRETLRHGPMKPVGLTNPHAPTEKPWAVVQLRRDNALGTLYNIVGFQTKMKYGAQVDVLRMIPGLAEAQFARLGGIHRNTFLNSPRLLDGALRLKSDPRLRFAGQITGVEGYVESAAMGLLAGRFAAAEARGEAPCPPPPETAHGALLAHLAGGAEAETFQPMNVNFGLFPPVTAQAKGRKAARKQARAQAMSAREPCVEGGLMAGGFLDKAYGLEPGKTTEGFYDDWAASYDAEIAENGYATPRRCAEALVAAGADRAAAALDYGCGTGLSGLALRAAGFTTVDGWDVSEKMLEEARAKRCYRALLRIESDGPPPAPHAPYATVVAAGVIGVGAAPAEAFDWAMGLLAPDGLCALSLNDHALADPSFEARINDWLDCGAADLIAKEYGPHLPGIDLGATVYVLRKR